MVLELLLVVLHECSVLVVGLCEFLAEVEVVAAGDAALSAAHVG